MTTVPNNDDPVVAQAYGLYQLKSGKVLISKELYRGIIKLEKRLATGKFWRQQNWQRYGPREQ